MALTKVTGSVIKDSVSLSGNVSIGGTLTYEDVTNVDSVGVITARSTIDAQGDVSIADKIIHTGDTNTAIRFPAADTITAETNGSERLRIASSGQLKQTAASGDTIFTFKRSNTNTTGAVGVLNFAASDEHSVANIQVLGDGDNEGAHITFQTTTAATSADPFNAATVERLRITSGGNVGINQSSPTAKLEVVDSAYHQLYLKGSGTVGGIRFGNSGNQSGFIYYDNGPNLLFNVNNSEKVRITSTGAVIVAGTSAYSDGTFGEAKLQFNTRTGNHIGACSVADTTNSITHVLLKNPNGAIASVGTHNSDFIVLTGNTERARITSAGNFGIGDDSPAVRLEVKDNSSNNYGTTIRLSQGYNSVFSEIASNFGGSMTLNAGEGTTTAIMHFQVNNSEKMRLNNSGQLLVGTTSATSLGSHTGASNVSTFNQSGITLTQYGVTTGFYYDRLNFTNSQYFIVNSSSTGVYLGNGSTSWTAYSDERLKTNITELDGTKAYNHVKTARAASFKWNATGYPTDMKIGFIAQDWETNYPEVVNTTTETIDSVENPKGIQYTETVPVLMAALKQAISKIESFEARIATLEGS